jgi:hypothetical protein
MVYVLCCNAQVNLIVILMTFVRLLYSINCPTVICLSSMLFILWRDTTSELWTPVHSFTLLLPFTIYCFIYILANTIFCHSIRLILCLQQTGEIDNLTISWGIVLGCVVCRFHVAAGAKLRRGWGAIYKLFGAVAKLASINLWKLVSYWFDKPWFHTEGRLTAVLIIPSSWGSQLDGHLHAISEHQRKLHGDKIVSIYFIFVHV